MEQHKGNQIRAILNELQLSQKANAPAVQYQRLIKLLLHCIMWNRYSTTAHTIPVFAFCMKHRK